MYSPALSLVIQSARLGGASIWWWCDQRLLGCAMLWTSLWIVPLLLILVLLSHCYLSPMRPCKTLLLYDFVFGIVWTCDCDIHCRVVCHAKLIMGPWCIFHYDFCYVCWHPMDYEIMFRLLMIFIMVYLRLILSYALSIFFWSLIRLFLHVLVVSPLHSITLAMWLGITPRGSYLARWLSSYLPMISLSDKNMSLGNVSLPPRRTQWCLWLRVTFITYFTHLA